MTRIVRLSMCLGLFMSVHAKAATVREAGEAVREAYYDVLGRAPDPEGMKTYRKRVLEDGWSAGRIRDVLRESASTRTIARIFGFGDPIKRFSDGNPILRGIRPVARPSKRRAGLRNGTRFSSEKR